MPIWLIQIVVGIGAGGGGGGGGFKSVFVEGPLEAAAIVVGAGGPPSEAAGGPGGDSSLTMGDIVVSAPGGLGGGVGNAVASFNSRQGGVGGSPTGNGVVNVPGDPGGHSTQVGSSSGLGSSAAIAGNGGRSQLGGGGRAGRAVASNPAIPTFVAGNPGNGYGAGGGGSAVIVGTSANGSDQAEPGGAGAPGVVIVWEFVDG